MYLNADGPEVAMYHPAILPVDSQSGANNGITVSLKGYAGVEVIIIKKAGVAGDDPVITMKQATDVADTGLKALNVDRIFSKLHATTVPGAMTLNTQSAGATYTDDTSAEKSGLIIVDIKAEDLDVANGFDCVKLTIPDTGSAGAQLIAAVYRLYGPRYGGAGMVSPIAD